MAKEILISVTGDKGGVGKSTITALLAEWFVYAKQPIKIIDADINQSSQTWIDKCKDMGRSVSFEDSKITVVDCAGTGGSSLSKYIRQSDVILVPFKPHIADLEVIIAWFLSIKAELQERVYFIPNMVSTPLTKEQKEGFQAIRDVIAEEGKGCLLPGISERKAIYPPLLNGSKTNFFDKKLDSKTLEETQALFSAIKDALKV